MNHTAPRCLLLALLYLNAAIVQAAEPGRLSLDAIDLNASTDNVLNVYSDIDMQARLAIKPNEKDCTGSQCELNKQFDAQVQRQGERMAAIAYQSFPDLNKRIPAFKFEVVEKRDAGMASNGAGKIVVFRGVGRLGLSDDALAFILAREMGHVIARHHNKNTGTKILFSVLASVLFPAATLLSASHIAAEATTTVVTSVASTATSFLGSEVAISKIKPNQLAESDAVAMTLMDAKGWDANAVLDSLPLKDKDANPWLKDLSLSAQHLEVFSTKQNSDNVGTASMAAQPVLSP